MSDYGEPRRVTLTLADTRRTTILERARACALAGIAEREIAGLLRAVAAHEGAAADLERGVLLLYAIAYQLERRVDPSLSWDTAQSWDLALDLESAPDPLAEAEARASVETALATGLPPGVAGELTLAQVDAYGAIRRERDERDRHARSRRGRRS